MNIKTVLVSILLVVICVGAGYYAGHSAGQREISPRDTVEVTRTIEVPAKPAVILKPIKIYYDTTIFVSRIDSLIATADSLRSLLLAYLPPFSGESTDSLRAGLATIHYRAIGVAFPLDRSISFALDSITIDLPERIITQTVEIPEPWYSDPLWFVGGIGAGFLLLSIAQ